MKERHSRPSQVVSGQDACHSYCQRDGDSRRMSFDIIMFIYVCGLYRAFLFLMAGSGPCYVSGIQRFSKYVTE